MRNVLRWTGQINVLIRNWRIVSLRAGMAVFFGAVLLAWPGVRLDGIAHLFGAFAVLDGALAFLSAFRTAGRGQRWWALLMDGVAGLVFGIAAFVIPDLDVSEFCSLVAAWSAVSGAFELAAAVLLRREVRGELWLVASGVSSLIFALLMVRVSQAGIVAIAKLIACYCLAFGALLSTLSLQLRSMHVTNLRE